MNFEFEHVAQNRFFVSASKSNDHIWWHSKKRSVLSVLMKNYVSETDEERNQNVSQISQNINDDYMFFGVINNTAPVTITQEIENEIQKCSTLLVDYQSNFDVLKWWYDHKMEFKQIFKTCIMYSCF